LIVEKDGEEEDIRSPATSSTRNSANNHCSAAAANINHPDAPDELWFYNH